MPKVWEIWINLSKLIQHVLKTSLRILLNYTTKSVCLGRSFVIISSANRGKQFANKKFYDNIFIYRNFMGEQLTCNKAADYFLRTHNLASKQAATVAILFIFALEKKKLLKVKVSDLQTGK